MKLLFLNIYPKGMTQYLFSSYLLIGCLKQNKELSGYIESEAVNIPAGESNIAGIIKNKKYDILCLPCYVWNREQLLSLCENINARRVIWGGPEISESFAEKVSGGQENYFIIGEGEKKLEYILKYFLGLDSSGGYKLESIAEKAFIVNDSIDGSPCSFFKIYAGGIVPDNLIRHQTVLLETQRGCVFNCSYCNYSKALSAIRYHKIEDVRAEIEYLTQKKAREIRITDAVFTSDLNRAKEIIRFLLELKKAYNYIPAIFLEADMQCIDEEFISLLGQLKNEPGKIRNIQNLYEADAGQMYTGMTRGYKCVLGVGVQSLHAPALKACRRYAGTSEKIMDFTAYISKYNIALKIDIILGLPGETKESYMNGLRKLLPIFDGTDHILNIHILKVLPNTKLMEEYAEHKIIFEKSKHNVIETGAMDCGTLFEMKKLSAVLFRVINSSFRGRLFNLLNTGIDLYDLLSETADELNKAGQLPQVLKAYNDILDDDYWNMNIFHDLKSKALKNILC